MCEHMSLREEVCGFTLTPERAGDEVENLDRWYERTRGVTCIRETWGDEDRCIWHAKVDNKPVEEFQRIRTEESER